MEVGSFRGFRAVLGLGGGGASSASGGGEHVRSSSSSASSSSPSSAGQRHKPRAHSSSSSSSSSRSSRSRSHRPSSEELNLPLDREFVPVATSSADGTGDDDPEPAMDEVREEVICMIFDLPRATTFYKDFSCAIAAAFPMHGRMYPTSTHVCFYSNVFGRERKILIPYETITEIALTTTLMFQGAIKIKTATNDEYTFTSFWGANRESCFELITEIHRRVVGDHRGDSEPEPSALTTTTDVPTLLRTVSDGGIVAAPRDISMTLLLEDKFDVSVATFLDTFIWDSASFGAVQYNERIGTTEMQCDAWSDDTGTTHGRTRGLQFRVPIDSPIGPKSSRVDVLQCCKAMENGVYVIESSTRLVDIPYGDYFSVEDRWTLVPHPRNGNVCTLTIELKVVFAKSTFWRNQIESRALSDNKSKWTTWVQMAKQHLQEGSEVRNGKNEAMRASQPVTSNDVGHTHHSTAASTPQRPIHRRPTTVGDVESRVDDAQASKALSTGGSSSSSRRRRRRRAVAIVVPWLLILVLLWMISRLNATVARMEALILSTHARIEEIQVGLARLRMERDVCR